MDSAADIVSTVFTTAVLVVLLYTIYTVQAGGNISGIVDIVSRYAEPFVIAMILLFVILIFWSNE